MFVIYIYINDYNFLVPSDVEAGWGGFVEVETLIGLLYCIYPCRLRLFENIFSLFASLATRINRYLYKQNFFLSVHKHISLHTRVF